MSGQGSAMRVKAVLFDLGGTLHNYRREKVLHELLSEKGLDVSEDKIIQAYEEIDPIWEELTADLPQQYMWPDMFFEQLDQLILEQLGIHKDQAKVARFIRENWNRTDSQLPQTVLRQPYNDALPCLTSLQKLGVKMGIVSNIPSHEKLRTELEAIGLHSFFSVLIASGAIGAAKPDTLVFEKAPKSINESASRILFVGDNPWRDYHGALRAGMKALLIDRRGVFNHYSDICRISSLAHIPSILAET